MVLIKVKQLVSAEKTPWTAGDPVYILQDAAVAVKNGVVADVGYWEDLKRRYATEEVWDFGDSLLTPGARRPPHPPSICRLSRGRVGEKTNG